MSNRVETFFQEIGYLYTTVKKYSRETELYLSNRFNVFNYIKPDENKLSTIIADLLDVHGGHGQGSVFLNSFLELLPSSSLITIAQGTPRVHREMPTSLI
jgi:hypothetical protein